MLMKAAFRRLEGLQGLLLCTSAQVWLYGGGRCISYCTACPQLFPPPFCKALSSASSLSCLHISLPAREWECHL